MHNRPPSGNAVGDTHVLRKGSDQLQPTAMLGGHRCSPTAVPLPGTTAPSVDDLHHAARPIHPCTDLVLHPGSRVLNDVRARLTQRQRDIGPDLGPHPESAEGGVKCVPHQWCALGVPRQGHFEDDLHAYRLRSSRRQISQYHTLETPATPTSTPN